MVNAPTIPFIFVAIPYEFLTDDFVEDAIMMKFIFWMMKRISIHPKIIPLKNNHKHLSLQPYEFMYGRNKCAEDAGISPKNARTRLTQLIDLGYLEEVTSKKASTYSVYRIVTAAFRQNPGQHNGPQMNQPDGQQSGHKRETKIQENKMQKGTVYDNKKLDNSLLSDKQKEVLSTLFAYCETYNLRIGEKSLKYWVIKFDLDRITSHLSLLLETSNLVENHEAWMEKALIKNYCQKNSNVLGNRKFIENFVKIHQWSDLIITKAYCSHKPSSKDYKFDLPPDNFQRMIVECFEQYNITGH